MKRQTLSFGAKPLRITRLILEDEREILGWCEEPQHAERADSGKLAEVPEKTRGVRRSWALAILPEHTEITRLYSENRDGYG
jgi:hypothetical protein